MTVDDVEMRRRRRIAVIARFTHRRETLGVDLVQRARESRSCGEAWRKCDVDIAIARRQRLDDACAIGAQVVDVYDAAHVPNVASDRCSHFAFVEVASARGGKSAQSARKSFEYQAPEWRAGRRDRRKSIR